MTDSAPPLREPLFYCTDVGNGDAITLTDEEAHHITVQRLRRGDALALFDGHGNIARGTVEEISRSDVRVSIAERRAVAAPKPSIHLYCAIPKGDRLSVLLDMATQLGMASFTPVTWQRSVTDPKPEAQERWRRICLEACKQSRRPHLPTLQPAVKLADAITLARDSHALALLAHPAEQALPPSAINLRGVERLALFIGPEGGITDAEVALLQSNEARLINLGAGILRIETAAVALIALAGGIHP